MMPQGREGVFGWKKLIIQLYLQTMSLMSAGKQISNQAFGRGLFVVDPDVAEREATKKNAYKEELRIQMQEQSRRKQDEKRKLREEDDRLQKKIDAEIQRQKNDKSQKKAARNDKNITLPPVQKSQMIKSEFYKEQPIPLQPKREDYQFKFSLRAQTEEDRSRNPYLRQQNPQQMQEEQFFDESSAQKLRAMKEMLEEKMNEVYRKINQSKNLQLDKELERIRLKINQNNVNYEKENPTVKEFQNEFSQFYRVPKKMTYDENQVRNLNYESRTELKRNQLGYNRGGENAYAPVAAEERMAGSRNRDSGESSRSKNNKEGWGRKKGKGNFLGNREAADFQIESISNNIDNILNEYDQ